MCKRGSYNTPEFPGKTAKSIAGVVVTAGWAPAACVVPKSSGTILHRDDLRRSRDEQSNAAISVSQSSVNSDTLLERQEQLLRSRELARKRRERLAAEEEELLIEQQLAAMSTLKRSSAPSVRSSLSPRGSERAEAEETSTRLTAENVKRHILREHVRSVQVEAGDDLQPLDLFADLAVPVFPGTDVVDHAKADSLMREVCAAHRETVETPGESSRRPSMNVAVAKASLRSNASKPPEVHSFQSFDVEDKDREVHVTAPASPDESMPFVGCQPSLSEQEFIRVAEARHAEEIHFVRQETRQSLDHKVIEMVTDVTQHIEAANVRAQNVEIAARAAEKQANEKLPICSEYCRKA